MREEQRRRNPSWTSANDDDFKLLQDARGLHHPRGRRYTRGVAYFHWVEGEMEGFLIASDADEARALLEEPDNQALVVTRLDGPFDPIDFEEAQVVLGDQHAAVLALRRLGLSLAETKVPHSSHFGGSPRLAPEAEWPGGAKPLPLLLELDLAEVAEAAGGCRLGLPASGYLALFFARKSQSREFAVRYSPAGSPQRSAPAGCATQEPCSVVSGLELTSPHPDDPALLELFADDAELLNSYAALYEESADGGHRLLGHAHWFNGRGDTPAGVVQLLQIRGVTGDFGVDAEECYLNLLISEADLTALDFARCQLVIQLD